MSDREEFGIEAEGREMTGPEAIIFLTDEIEDETKRSDAYREAAISLIDHLAEEAVFAHRKERQARRDRDESIMNMTTPFSNSTH